MVGIRIPHAIYRRGAHRAAPKTRLRVLREERTLDGFPAICNAFRPPRLVALNFYEFSGDKADPVRIYYGELLTGEV